MEYWVAMNKKELQIALILLESMELAGVVEVDPLYKPQKTDFEKMIEKRFFEQDDTGVSWNPFVKMVLSSAVHAQSMLEIKNDKFLRKIYFISETMILLTKDTDEDIYFFYYVPLIPKAIGGLAKSLEKLKKAMDEQAGDLHAPMSIEGWCFGEQTLECSLIFANDKFYLIQEESTDMPAEEIKFYKFMEYIGKWVVKTHGKSLALKEENYERA